MRLRALHLPLLALLILPALPAWGAPPAKKARNPKPLRNLVYAKVGDRDLRLDLYRPPPTDRPTPVVLWLHGGGWRMGTKAFCPYTWLRDAGFAVASVQYRLTSTAIFPAQIHDVKAAVRWLRANAETYGLDPDHVGVAGASAGGHLAALLGTTQGITALEGRLGDHVTTSSRVQAVYDLFGPTDLVHLHTDAHRAGRVPEAVDALALLLGGRVGKKRGLAALGSPLTHVTPNDAPFLIVHGDRDPLVPLAQSVRLHRALKAAGVTSDLHIIEGASHGGLSFIARPERKRLVAFLRRHLRVASKAPERSAGR